MTHSEGILDDPTLLLQESDWLRRLARGLCSDRGLAVLWATHLVDEAERAHHVVVLDQGEILTEGSPDSLVALSNADSLEGAFLKLTAITKEQTKA